MSDTPKEQSTAMQELHSNALDRFKIAADAEQENRLLAESDFEFAAGEQWPDEIKKERSEDGRPCLTINRLPQYIRQVMGDARQNKPAIKVRPVEDSDEEIAEILEGLVRSIEVRSNAPQAYMTGLEHTLTGGFGHWRVTTDYCDNDSFDQDINIEPIRNPFAVFWDAGAQRYDKSDADWCFVTQWMSKEEFERKYPNDSDTDWEVDQAETRNLDWTDESNKVRVAEYWVKKRIEKTLYDIPGYGSVTELPEGYPSKGLRSRKIYDIEIERYVLSGSRVLEGPHKWAGKYIPIVPVTGVEEYIGGAHRYLSLIRYAKDPQRMYNYWQSTITEKIALAPKSPWLITADQLKGLEPFWNNANTSNLPYLPYNSDPMAGGAPQRTQPAAINSAEIGQSAQSIDDLKATTGIYDASLGARGNETSGVAIRQREIQGDTSVFAWIDNLGRSIEYTGRILIDLIPHIYDTTRMVEILGEDDVTTKLVQLNQPQANVLTGETNYTNDLSVGKYDVAVSIGPSFNTKRQEASESMLSFMQAYPPAAPYMGDLIAKNMDWPGADAIAARLKKLLPPGVIDEELTPEEQQQMQQAAQQEQEKQAAIFQMELEAKQAEIGKDKSVAVKNLADAESQSIENDVARSGIGTLLDQLSNL